MNGKKHLSTALIGAALSAALVSGASALTLGTIPGVGNATNQGIDPIYGASTREGYYGANLALVGGGGTANITFMYLGAEAGFKNQFTFGALTLFETQGGGSVWNSGGLGAIQTFSNVADGMLNFAFIANAGNRGTLSAINGANQDDSGGASSVNFFASVLADSDAQSGSVWDLWFDDGGAGNDDNHDDMAIRVSVNGGHISQVPVPAAGFLLLGALVGFGALRRRKTT